LVDDDIYESVHQDRYQPGGQPYTQGSHPRVGEASELPGSQEGYTEQPHEGSGSHQADLYTQVEE